jgi:Ca2+-transporting ATPase
MNRNGERARHAPPSVLDHVFTGVVARGGTARSLFVALANEPVTQVDGRAFRAALDRFGLRSGLDAVFQDEQVLELLDTLQCKPRGTETDLEFHFSGPQVLRRNLAFGDVHLELGEMLCFIVDDAGEVRLRAGDVRLRWLMLSESLLVHLRVVETPEGSQEVVDLSAGGVFTQRVPLEPLFPLAAVPPAPVQEIPAPAPVATDMACVIHRLAGRLRVRVKGLYHGPKLKTRLEQQLGIQAGVSRVSASLQTGTVLVTFDVSLDHEQIVAWVVQIAAGQDLAAPAQATPPAPWHALSAAEVVAYWESSATQGLSAGEAAVRLQIYGANRLPEPEPRSALALFVDQFRSLPVMLLGVSALVSVATGGLADAAAILGVVLVNAAIGYLTEGRAERIIASVTRGVQPTALVVRNGASRELPGEQLVPGDLILLKRGMIVPADARLLEVEQLMLDESALTGESVPVEKQTAPVYGEFVPLSERVNLIHRGTVVTGGNGRAVVVATGLFTEVGLIQRLLTEARQPETPLQRQLGQISRQLVLLSMGICGALFGIGLLRGRGLLQMFRISVSLMVAAVPEGLPTVATTTLALGLRHLESHKVLVRRLSIVETLGVVQQVCLDKTGTLTLNRMTLVAVHTGTTTYEIRANELWRAGAPVDIAEAGDVRTLLWLATLCSEVEFDTGDHRDANSLRGTPTETALVRAAIAIGVDLEQARAVHPPARMRLRSEQRSFMDTLHTNGNNGADPLLVVKGRPADVLAMCDRLLSDGAEAPLDLEDRLRIETENERMAGRALRVLGIAYREGDGTPEIDRNLVWVGLAGIADPPREGVAVLLDQLYRAGIHTTMITGDQSATAQAIARQIGLNRQGRMEILDATQLDQLEPDVLRALTQRVAVFSRVSPAHKLKIVQALQRGGRVVAMTGDGVNDGPALRAADVGIAMGGDGSEVAQEVADALVLDDRLETIVLAVEQGRTIYNDIRKAVHFILSSNTSEILVTFLATAGGLGEPLLPMQLLWINLVTDIFPELALGVEPPEVDVMRRPPRDPHAPMFSPQDLREIAFEGVLLTAATLGAYGWGLMRYGLGPRAGTLAFTTLTGAQLMHAVSCRSELHCVLDSTPMPKNPYIPLAVGGGLALQAAAVLVPGLRTFLGATPLGLADWAVTGAAAVTPFFINEWRKLRRAPPCAPKEE